MKKSFGFLFLSLFILGRLSAQTFLGNLNPFPVERSVIQQDDTVKILAVMVSFEEDRDAATFGNGKFGSIYSQDYGNTILDPLPHDQQYFESHLEFVKNYFARVSNGNLHIEYTVIPDTFSVSQTMRNYSPPPGSDDFTPLGNFSQEVWIKASELFPEFDFSAYNLFIIFHAGVGRDISLPGSLGNERDLPSVYLSKNALKNIFGEAFEGFPVQNGSFMITNTMIMPETESRELETLTGKFLFEISINGLLVASVASHLGLPDLFNTETGLSAIGRFGLMDGQSIFAYNGTFPPEPSAWEKIYLGWADYITLDPGDYQINLTAKLAAALTDTVIIKVPLNSSEYYLIENRNRDVNKDGSTVTYKIGNDTFTKTFFDDIPGYRSFDTDSLSGVIVDVDEHDWALPGNGILIWHIDEKVISEKLAQNKINVDKNRRGVSLEEADGIPDIGERFFTIFGDEVIGEGTQEDLWYSSNPSELYTNKFAKNTRPSTRTNSGANSLLTLSDFSGVGNKMSFSISYGDSLIVPIFTNRLYFSEKVRELTVSQNSTDKYFNLLVGRFLKVYLNQTEIRTISDFSDTKPASIFLNGILYTFGTLENNFNSYMVLDDQIYFGQATINSSLTTDPLVVAGLNELPNIIAGTSDGKVIYFTTGGLPSNDPQVVRTILIDSLVSIIKLASDGTDFAVIAGGNSSAGYSLFSYNGQSSYRFDEESLLDLAMTRNSNDEIISVVLTDRGNFYVFRQGNLQNNFSVRSLSGIHSFSLADLRKDGNIYILFNNDNKIEARNFEGALADNYPLTDTNGAGFTLTPLAMDFEGDDRTEVISFTNDGRIFAFNGPSGRMIDGFPISVGTNPVPVPVLFSDKGKPSISVIDDNNHFSAWNLGSVDGLYYWSEKNSNSVNLSFVPVAEVASVINEFFPKNRAYNYPNPVYEGQTFIRYYVSEESKINIKIFDLGGGFVAELNDIATGGLDSETVWNVSDVQSGVYFARIEAVSTSGKSESQVIKIAVVK